MFFKILLLTFLAFSGQVIEIWRLDGELVEMRMLTLQSYSNLQSYLTSQSCSTLQSYLTLLAYLTL
jgi:muconolactone delta-isomerase